MKKQFSTSPLYNRRLKRITKGGVSFRKLAIKGLSAINYTKARQRKEAQSFTGADCVIGLSFGSRLIEGSVTEPGSVNEQLAAYIAEHFAKVPLLLQHEIADALHEQAGIIPELRISADSTEDQDYQQNPLTSEVDSRQVLLAAKKAMDKHQWSSAIIVAQAHHLPRIKAICSKLGIHLFIPDDLPDIWDKESSQWWTRSRLLWNMREPAALAYHKMRGWI